MYPSIRGYRPKEIMEVRQTTALLLFAFASFGFSQDFESDQPQSIPLTVPASVPLRLYLTKRVPKRVGAPVDAKLVGPVYAFDHEVIPVGTQAIGHVSTLQSVSKWERTRAILGGDFTPLHVAQIEFTSLVLADGREVQVQTASSAGLNSLFPLRPPKQRNPNNTQRASGVLGSAKQNIKDQTNAQIDRIKGIPDLVRSTNKREWLSDYMMSRLPYHPQYVRSRTRFDAELAAPLNFGSEPVAPGSLALLGTQPASGAALSPVRYTSPIQPWCSVFGGAELLTVGEALRERRRTTASWPEKWARELGPDSVSGGIGEVMLKHECAALTRANAVSTARARIANRSPRLGRRQTMLEYDERLLAWRQFYRRPYGSYGRKG